MKKSPLFSIHYYSLGNELDIGGHTGGIAGEYWSTESNIINSVNLIYLKNKRDNKWFLAEFKKEILKDFQYLKVVIIHMKKESFVVQLQINQIL